MSRYEMIEKIEELRAEKKRLEESGLIPDYDYPDPSNLGTERKTQRPATALNNNPGPDVYFLDSQFGKIGKGFSFTSTKNPPRCQFMWTENDDSPKSKTANTRKKNSIPVETIPGWKEKPKVSGSIYQNIHNAQALSTRKVDRESRGKIRPWRYVSYNSREGPSYSLASRTWFNGEYQQYTTPGPGAYTLDRRFGGQMPMISFGGRLTSSLDNGNLLKTDEGLASLS